MFFSHVGQGSSQAVDRALMPWIGCRPVDVKDLVLAVVEQAVEGFLSRQRANQSGDMEHVIDKDFESKERKG